MKAILIACLLATVALTVYGSLVEMIDTLIRSGAW